MVPNIADEIRFRGGHHAVEIISLQAEVCGPELAEALESAVGAVVFHTVLVHKEDDLPVQIEDRYVNPEAAPHYLKQNFGSVTPNAYLSAIAPIVKAEQLIEAVSCQAWECRHLAIGHAEPCLLVRRRTWSKTGTVSTVRSIYPGSRYSLATLS